MMQSRTNYTLMVRKFAFFGPYITGPGAQELRARLKETHIAELKKNEAAGFISVFIGSGLQRELTPLCRGRQSSADHSTTMMEPAKAQPTEHLGARFSLWRLKAERRRSR
jgi:hypothetical protein